MREKQLRSGIVAYYWAPSKRDRSIGFTLRDEALGTDFSTAKSRADMLNQHLDDWRKGRSGERSLDLQPGHGTLAWIVERYKRSPAWEKVGERARPDYTASLTLILDMTRKSGGTVGATTASAIDASAVDRIYARLQIGPRGKRLRTAVLAITLMARAWDVVARLCPTIVPNINPFRGVEMSHKRTITRAASLQDAIALHHALIAAGEPHLAAIPLICHEWHQRPENIITGALAWTDYRPNDATNTVRIEHTKTGAMVLLPLSDEDGPFFPELTSYLDQLPRIGVPIVLSQPKILTKGNVWLRSSPRPFQIRTARTIVRKAARAAGLPDWLTLAACRHGGMTELGDSGATEQEVMASSGHSAPSAARLYIKKTETQRLTAARKRRALREHLGNESRNEHPTKSRNAAS